MSNFISNAAVVFLTVMSLLANSSAVHTHMLCSVDDDNSIKKHHAIEHHNVDEDSHHCSHSAHHEPVSEQSEDDHCTPCVNDFYDFSEKSRVTDRISLSSISWPVSVFRYATSLDTRCTHRYGTASERLLHFMPQYSPLTTVILS